jgi:hypothetical protein
MSEPNDTHTTAWRFVRRRQAPGALCFFKPPEPWVFSKNLPGFQKFFKNLLCQNSQISLNSRSGDKPQAESVNPRACSLRRPGVLLAGP